MVESSSMNPHYFYTEEIKVYKSLLTYNHRSEMTLKSMYL